MTTVPAGLAWSAILWLALTGSAVASAVQVGGPVPKQILDDWLARRSRCQSAYWKIECRELIPPGFLNGIPPDEGQFGPLPAQDLWRTREFELWIDFEPLRIRCEMRGLIPYVADDGTTPFEPIHSIHLLQGTDLQTIHVQCPGAPPVGDNAFQVRTLTGNGPGLMLEAALEPCLWALGRVGGPENPHRADQLNEPFRPRLFRVHAVRRTGSGEQVVLRAPRRRDRSDAYMELVTASDMASAIVSLALATKNGVERQFHVEWEEDPSGWMPVSWTMAELRQDGTPFLSSECRVVQRVCNPDLARIEFHVVPSPGTRFWDEAQNSILVKAEPGQPDIPLQLFLMQESARERRRFWMIAGFLVVVAAVGAFAWRRVRASSIR